MSVRQKSSMQINNALKIALHGGRVNRGAPKLSFFFDKPTRIRLYVKICMATNAKICMATNAEICMATNSRCRLGINGILFVRYRTGNDYRRAALFCISAKNEVLDSKNTGDA